MIGAFFVESCSWAFYSFFKTHKTITESANLKTEFPSPKRPGCIKKLLLSFFGDREAEVSDEWQSL